MSPFQISRTLPEDATDAAVRADVLRGLSYDARARTLVEPCGSFILSVVRAAVLTLALWRVLAAAGVAPSAGEPRPLPSTDGAPTEERHS